ncbi:probable coilin at C-terminar half [Coccomyxa sp. Obi]|nr:probable coilin at C-terminar half [Coccomyxa sp. Obi]
MAAPAPRLFLTFDPNIKSKIVRETSNRVLYEPRKVVHTIDSLVSLIAEDFGIPATQRLCLSVNGYAAPPQGPASLLRNNDIVTVTSAFTNANDDWKHGLETAIRNAVSAGPICEVLSSVLAAAHTGATKVQAQPISGNAGKIIAKSGQMPGPTEKLLDPTKKRARADATGTAAVTDEPELQKKKKRVSSSKKQAETAANPEEPTAQPMPAPAAKHAPGHTPPLTTNGGGGADVSSDESDSSEEAGAEGKGPSRSARRKKLKRQLRRQGLLDSAHKQAAPDGRATAAAGRARRVEESPAAAQALPKRGEAWARSRADMQFMQEGHVYFTDSDEGEGQPDGDNRSRTSELQRLQRPTPGQLPGPPPVQPKVLHGKAPSANGHVSNGDSHQQRLANGHQEPRIVPARLHESAPVIQPKVQKPAVDAGPQADAEFEALQKPDPHVMEGDVIAYRLLHIGDDWTPQVSEWRKGRVTSLEEQGHVLSVEPWPDSSVHPVLGPRQPSPAAHDTWQQGADEASDEEEEMPPSDYTDDGVLVTALESFSDIRLIRRATHAPETGPQQKASEPEPAKSTGEAIEGVSNGPVASVAIEMAHADRRPSSAPQNGHSGLQLASGPPNHGPPKSGGAMVPSIGAWAELAAELKRRREVLATKQSSAAQAASLFPPSSPSSHLTSGGPSASTGQGPQQPSANGVLVASQARDPGATAVSEQQQSQGQPDQAAQEKMQSGSAAESAVIGGAGDESPVQLIGSGIGKPGASKPRPGVRSSAIGPLLARLRREAAED